MKLGELNEYFTNHSLRRTGTTRLFQAGIDCKLIKEFMGYTSDAADRYQVMSNNQREQMSNIIQGNILDAKCKSKVETVVKPME